MYIRRFDPADADAVVRVSELATRITSGAVYDAAFVEEMVAQQDQQKSNDNALDGTHGISSFAIYTERCGNFSRQ